jgi:hypothetical protein
VQVGNDPETAVLEASYPIHRAPADSVTESHGVTRVQAGVAHPGRGVDYDSSWRGPQAAAGAVLTRTDRGSTDSPRPGPSALTPAD